MGITIGRDLGVKGKIEESVGLERNHEYTSKKPKTDEEVR